VTIYGIEPQPRGDAKIVVQDGDAFTLDGSEVMIVVVITRQIPHVILDIGMLSNDAPDQRELEFHVLLAAGEHEQNDVHLRNPNCPLLETVTGDSPADAGAVSEHTPGAAHAHRARRRGIRATVSAISML
jgi:hypothetical protein